MLLHADDSRLQRSDGAQRLYAAVAALGNHLSPEEAEIIEDPYRPQGNSWW
ncbi:hypothetical protein [Cellulomonas xiejunii]|uniref:Uncharacterized protein n=1 Tax=Cellulomonas xiejunii TaxID=2968083 RepID=A0ABY5KP62_9CELL|nr:hypothetical protein [Cellulomonas xiejunii]MCC2322218.1 hypothetical protein [Cellulomonas xiejunii]UUI72271.1 hypothetical protein NP048_02040 [Cellulomonas xiejunii]